MNIYYNDTLTFYSNYIHPFSLTSYLASIGYDPEVALCDILDNSVSANSKKIQLLILDNDSVDNDENGIDEYWIIDNGYGMDEEGLKLAFGLGSDRTYQPGSLGKFGLGLKSAGLSLGNRLTFITKTKESKHYTAVLDRNTIREKNKYGVTIFESKDKEIEVWNKYLSNEVSGSILRIDRLSENQPSFGSFSSFMKEYIGLLYHKFIEQGISFFVNDNPAEGFDPLFTKEADENGGLDDYSTWDGKSVKWLLKDYDMLISDSISIKIQATQLVHPPSFFGDQSKVRAKYGIGSIEYTKQLRHGFYVYRNNRIIGIAERFYGIVSTEVDHWAFRGRILFDETADELLELDVKKRHIRLSTILRNKLKNQLSKYISLSKNAWVARANKVKEEKEEKAVQVSSKEIGNSVIATASHKPTYDKEHEREDSDRKNKQDEVASSTLQSIVDSKVTKEALKESAEKKDVIKFTEGMKGNVLWNPYPSTEENVIQAIINRSNSWIATAYTAAETNKDIVAVEILNSILYILARADSEIRTNYEDIDEKTVERIMNRYRRLVAQLAEEYADKLEERMKGEFEKPELI